MDLTTFSKQHKIIALESGNTGNVNKIQYKWAQSHLTIKVGSLHFTHSSIKPRDS